MSLRWSWVRKGSRFTSPLGKKPKKTKKNRKKPKRNPKKIRKNSPRAFDKYLGASTTHLKEVTRTYLAYTRYPRQDAARLDRADEPGKRGRVAYFPPANPRLLGICLSSRRRMLSGPRRGRTSEMESRRSRGRGTAPTHPQSIIAGAPLPRRGHFSTTRFD
jgi:hypothetical protein